MAAPPSQAPSVQQTERPRLPIIDGPEAPTKQSITEKRSDGSFQVRLARRIPLPIERVWEALTDPAELRRWLGRRDLDLVDGGRYGTPDD
jgi:Activator of Hsp90 ATPase homolog 1-like protein